LFSKEKKKRKREKEKEKRRETTAPQRCDLWVGLWVQTQTAPKAKQYQCMMAE
jgi:hypothetical protein